MSHFRLAAHLSLAMIIFCALCWQVFKSCNSKAVIPDLIGDPSSIKASQPLVNKTQSSWIPDQVGDDKLWKFWIITLTILGTTMVWGAYVAGLDAGLVYNEFPKMGGRWFPSDGLFLQPAWQNFFYTHSAVQWLHRVLGCLSMLAVCGFAWALIRRPAEGRGLPFILLALVFIQFALGVATLLSGVNITLAALHQANAFLILAAMMRVGVALAKK